MDSILSHRRTEEEEDNDQSPQGDQNAMPLMTIQQLDQRRVFENEIQFNESLINERDQELRHIEQSIVDVNEIFRDLGGLVHEQQFMLGEFIFKWDSKIESSLTKIHV